MIVIQAVLIPGGDIESPRKQVLCTVKVCNDATGTDTTRNYTVRNCGHAVNAPGGFVTGKLLGGRLRNTPRGG